MSLQGTQQWGSDATVGDVALPVPLAVSHIAAALRDGGGAERPQTHRAAESAPRGVPVTPRAGRPFPNPVINARRRAALSHRPDGNPQRFSRSSGQSGAGHGGDNRAASGETEARSPGADGNGAAAGSSPPPPASPSPLGPRGAVWAPQKHLSHPRHAVAAAARPAASRGAAAVQESRTRNPPRVSMPGKGGLRKGGRGGEAAAPIPERDAAVRGRTQPER